VFLLGSFASPSAGLLSVPSRWRRRGRSDVKQSALPPSARRPMRDPALGDWSTQTQDPWALLDAVGAEAVKQRGEAGDREALFS